MYARRVTERRLTRRSRNFNVQMKEPITPTEYGAFQKAYDFFNAELFLTPCRKFS